MAEEKDAPVEVEQTPEEIAEIEAANKARQRNINKIFGILVAVCLAGLAIFLAVYISTHNNDRAASDDGFVTQQMEIPVEGNTGFAPDLDVNIEQENGQ